jgi:hypothetical protein
MMFFRVYREIPGRVIRTVVPENKKGVNGFPFTPPKPVITF